MSLPDIADLPLVGQHRADKFYALGIKTLEKLIEAEPDALLKTPQFEKEKGFLNRDFPLVQGLARAWLAGEAIVLDADERLFNLKEPVIHLDLEFDGPVNQVFLWGLRWHGGKEEAWFDSTRNGQKDLLKRFQRLIEEEDPTIVTWGGAASDVVVLKRACEHHGMSAKWLNKVKWFDLQTEVVHTGSAELQQIYLPILRFKSEVVAAYFGYEKPKLRVKDGYTALKMYRKYRKRPNDEIRQNLIDYNREDVLHTEIILDGIRDLMAPLRP